jgi:hypothetical protein
MNVDAYCETQAQHDKNMFIAEGRICNIIGVAGQQMQTALLIVPVITKI